MRTFQRACPARPFIAASILATLLTPVNTSGVMSAPGSTLASPAPTVPLPTRSPAMLNSFQELQAQLDKGDQIAALHALQMALNQVGDGAVFSWKKNNKDLKGVIKPTAVFRNSNGQICRHVIYALSLGPYRKQIEFIACREAGGRWRL